MPNNANELRHFGILGMKWGHRSGSKVSTGYSSRKKLKAFLKNPALKRSVKSVAVKTTQGGARFILGAAKLYVGLSIATVIASYAGYVAWRVTRPKFV